MQRHRFYAPPTQINHPEIQLNEDEAYHLTRVLRLGVGAVVYAFDGAGHEYECRVAHADKRSATLHVQQTLTDAVDSPLRLTLAQALVKGDKFDWIVQKATELGVARIVPLITDNSDIRKAEERAEQKLTRWRRIALEAVKQCGRRTLVEIVEPQTFAEFCANDESESRWLLAERDGQHHPTLPAELSSLTVAIGPEGGWSQAERDLAQQHQFIALQLGQRVLRTETAAVAAVTLAQWLCGDYNLPDCHSTNGLNNRQ
jgi:16S rRNA (uracil1498-N3)-methyltransferase